MKSIIILLQAIFTLSSICFAQNGRVLTTKRFTNTPLIFGQNTIYVGGSIISLGDLNKDGSTDFFSTAIENGGTYPGNMNILFMDKRNDIIKSVYFKPGINVFPNAYNAVACLGDLNGNGGIDIAISNAENAGVVYIVSFDSNAKIKYVTEILASDVNPNGNSAFGNSVASIGDIDGDGVNDLAVGAPVDKDGGNGMGAVYIIFLTSSGDMKSYQKISSLQGGFKGISKSHFGQEVTGIGDLNRDSINDVIVSSFGNNGNYEEWVLFLNKTGKVKFHQKLASDSGNFDFLPKPNIGLSRPKNAGDINGDGINDLLVSNAGLKPCTSVQGL